MSFMIVETLTERIRAKFSPKRRSSLNKGNKQNELKPFVSPTGNLTKRLSIKVKIVVLPIIPLVAFTFHYLFSQDLKNKLQRKFSVDKNETEKATPTILPRTRSLNFYQNHGSFNVTKP